MGPEHRASEPGGHGHCLGAASPGRPAIGSWRGEQTPPAQCGAGENGTGVPLASAGTQGLFPPPASSPRAPAVVPADAGTALAFVHAASLTLHFLENNREEA